MSAGVKVPEVGEHIEYIQDGHVIVLKVLEVYKNADGSFDAKTEVVEVKPLIKH